MRRSIRFLLRLYPRAWLARYGDELTQLVADVPATPAAAIDIARHGLVLHARGVPSIAVRLVNSGGRIMQSHPQRFALLGAAILGPTAALIGLALLKYVIGVAAPFDALEPAVTPLVTHPVGETLLTLAPYLALALSVLPVVGGALRWEDGRLVGTLSFAAPTANIVIAASSAAVAVFMVVYWLAENL
jgi:hypothetical protein